MSRCEVLYSIVEDSSGLISTAVFIIIFTAVGIIVAVFIYKKSKDKLKKIVTIFFVTYILYIDIPLMYNSLSKYNELRNIYLDKHYKEAVGVISNYKVKKINEGYCRDSFEVNGTNFSYDSIAITGGYNKSQSDGGILKNGLYVKLKYIPIQKQFTKNLILSIELCKKKGQSQWR